MPMNVRNLTIAVAALAVSLPSLALGDEDACSGAYVKSQVLRTNHHLLEARQALRTCSQPSCKSFVVKDCSTWLEQVQSALPTVIPIATGDGEQVLSTAKVSIDGNLALEKIDGLPLEIDPGMHTFRFDTADGQSAVQQVVIVEGEKDKRITVSFAKPGTTPTTAPGTTQSGQPSAAAAGSLPDSSTPASASGTMKTLAIVAGAVGVVGIGVGIGFGLETSAKASAVTADCPSSANCPNHAQALLDHSAATDAATVSTTGFIAGGVLLAGGIVLWLVAPRGASESNKAAVHFAPTVAPGGTAGVVAFGTF
jgi:hypothetical protein